jgi:hypothetical protein
VCFHDQFFQVVLRKIRPSIFVYETDRALDEFTMTLQVLSVREADHDTVLVAVLLLDNVELHVLLALARSVFQVVLRKIRPSIFVYETDRALDEFTMTLQQRDRGA